MISRFTASITVDDEYSGGYIPEGNITFNEYKIDPACLRIPNPRQVCWDNHKFTAPHKGTL